MTKQEFLAMSLHHQIWCKILDYKSDYVGRPFDLIIGMNQWSKDGKLWSLRTLWGANPSFDRVLPICRPLSDLTNPIEHKGEKFMPMEKLREVIGSGWCGVYESAVEHMQEWDIDTLKDKINYLPFEFIQLFISWHFDIADLISKGEAVDVNELEVNPYK